MNYGIANKSGKPDFNELRKIICLAEKNSINFIDTASAYGDSERIIGDLNINHWKIISKLPQLSKYSASSIRKEFFKSLDNLKMNKIFGLLIHNSAELLSPNGAKLWNELKSLKSDGYITKIGVSIYNPDELSSIFDNFSLDIVQGPFNIMDRRIKQTGWLDILAKNNIEFHARSIFMQGALLLSPNVRKKIFNKWYELWDIYDDWHHEFEINQIDSAISFIKNEENLSKILIGLDTSNQLSEIIHSFKKKQSLFPENIFSNDIDLLEPFRWKVL